MNEEVIVYLGEQRPRVKDQNYVHAQDEWYFAPTSWLNKNPCPFSPGFPTKESAEQAKVEWMSRQRVDF